MMVWGEYYGACPFFVAFMAIDGEILLFLNSLSQRSPKTVNVENRSFIVIAIIIAIKGVDRL
jgi:hypothetical protein